MLRNASAVIAGFLTTVVLAVGTDYLLIQFFPGRGESGSLRLLIATLLYTEAFAAVGGYVTGRIARAMGAVYILTAIAWMITAANLFLVPNNLPVWYRAASILLLVPVTVTGGWLATGGRGGAGFTPRASLSARNRT